VINDVDEAMTKALKRECIRFFSNVHAGMRAYTQIMQVVVARGKRVGPQIDEQQQLLNDFLEKESLSDIDNLAKFRIIFNYEKDFMSGSNVFFLQRSWVKEDCPDVQEMAIPLMQMSAQNASIERICKAHGYNHSKIRNRLSIETQRMLLHIYVNQRLLDKQVHSKAKRLNEPKRLAMDIINRADKSTGAVYISSSSDGDDPDGGDDGDNEDMRGDRDNEDMRGSDEDNLQFEPF
jgi:hypothetical protein